MKAEEIVMRQEIRQMLNEAGINKNTLKDMVKPVLQEELQKACRQAIEKFNNNDSLIKRITSDAIKEKIQESVYSRIRSIFSDMVISIDIRDEHGASSISKR